MQTKRNIMKIILPVSILFIGLAGMTSMVLSKTPPQQKTDAPIGTLVETVPLKAENLQVAIQATGTVQPAAQVTLVPQVSGRVVRLADDFKVGRFFDKGQMLFEIDDADYRLAAEKSRANIAKAEFDLASMESQARVARKEWQRINPGSDIRPNPLVLYEPQLKKARAALAAAQADHQQRLLNLERTRILAPFNCRVRSKSVDVGQFITAGQSVATVAGTDMAEIVIPVPLQDLAWIDIPRSNRYKGSAARVYLNTGTDNHWNGSVDRSLGEVDPHSRMIRLVVKVQDPYGLKQDRTDPLDLAEGLFVNVTLAGKTLEQVFTVPVGALRRQETIWRLDEDQNLDIIPVEVVRREPNRVLVRGQLDSGWQLVTTRITGAAQGMHLRLSQEVES